MLQLLQSSRPPRRSGKYLLGEPAGALTGHRRGPGAQVLHGIGAQVRKGGQKTVQVLVNVGFGIVDEAGEEATVVTVHSSTRSMRMNGARVASQLVTQMRQVLPTQDFPGAEIGGRRTHLAVNH